jgi:thioredoxin-like negative regulator of GroEL
MAQQDPVPDCSRRPPDPAPRLQGGLLEPLYKLHAARLKMLRKAQAPLQLLAAHCFEPGSAERAAALLLGGPGGAEAELAALLAADCAAALAYCQDQYSAAAQQPHHKAHLALAKAHAAAGRLGAAAEQLRPLFCAAARAGPSGAPAGAPATPPPPPP